MSSQDADEQAITDGFEALSQQEIENVLEKGYTRKWIEGAGQKISWADSTTQILKKDTDGPEEWKEVKVLGRNMKGFLPRNWALEFSSGRSGKVLEG
jgi:hypothetical protein